MSSDKKKHSVSSMSEQSGISRQAFYKRATSHKRRLWLEKQVIRFVNRVRCSQNKVGMRKLFFMFKAEHQGDNKYKLGRDNFMEICKRHKLTFHLQKRKKRYKSADIRGEKLASAAPNLVPRGLQTIRPNTIWCSDITYLKAGGKHAYLSLVIDYHSRKIVGWCLSDNMRTEEVLKALDRALEHVESAKGIIHHSDRGSQYRSEKYRKRLEIYKMTASMTDGGKPYQNAKVERINGILKHELGLEGSFENMHVLRVAVAQAIHIYNFQRVHASLKYLTPNIVHHNDNYQIKINKNSVNHI